MIAGSRLGLIVEPNWSKVAVAGIGAAGVIAALVVFRALDRPAERRPPARVETTSTPPETTPAPVETLDPVAPVDPAARRIEPRFVPAPPAVPAAQAPAPPDGRELRDDAAILTKLHDLAASDPEQSLNLGREALARFPESSHAAEFEWNVVKALFNMGRLEEAKDAARVMVQNDPESDFTVDVERHLLNPQPNQ